MEVFALSLKLKEEGAAAVQIAVDKLRGSLNGVGTAATNAGTESAKGFKGMELGAVAAGAAIGATLVAALRKVVDESSTAQFAQAQLASALKSTGGVSGQSVDALNAHASALQKVTTYGDDAINGAQALLLTFTKIQGETFPQATTAVLNVATAMGTDLRSAAIQVGKALNDPIAGVTALARSGIQFTDTQKELIKTLVESGRQVEAQALVLKELESQFGGSATAARNTLGGALKALSNAFGDLFEVSADGMSPLIGSINSLAASLGKVRSAFDAVIPFAKGLALAFAAPMIVAFAAKLTAIRTALLAQVAAQRQTIAMARLEATAAASRVRALTLLNAGENQLTQAKIRAQIATANLAVQTSVLSRAMMVAGSVGRTMWAAIGGPIGAIIIGIAAVQAALDKYIASEERAIELRDEASQKDPAYIAALDAIAKRKAAMAQREQDATAATAAAAAVSASRVEDLVKLAGMTALNASELRELQTAERGYAAALQVANLPIANRITLLERQRALQDAILEQARKPMPPSAGIARGSERAQGLTVRPVLDVTPILNLNTKNGTLFDPAVMAKAQESVNESSNQLRDMFAEGIGNSIGDGIAAGFERGFASGSIGEGFKALAATLLSGLGSAMIRFGVAGAGFANLMKTFTMSLKSLNGPAALAASIAMIAAGGALKGVAQGMFGGGGGGARTSATTPGSFGSSGMGMQGDGNVTRLIFGATSATTAAGMTPRNATNVTIIGPDDPKAQRAIQELISKGNTRGTLG